MKRTLSVALLLSFMFGCGFVEQKENAESWVHKHFIERERGAIPLAADYYGEPFWKKTKRGDWERVLSAVEAKIGKPTTEQLKTWQSRQVVLSGASGTYVTLVYDVAYEHGKGTETFEVFRPSGSEKASIVSHLITSNDLLAK